MRQDRLRSVLSRLPDDSFRFVPGNQTIEGWYRAAGIFAMPSERDSMVTVKKSMSCGRPPIVKEHTGMPVDELEGHNITHMPIKRDESTMANRICQLAENSSPRQQLSTNARQHCLGQLSLENLG